MSTILIGDDYLAWIKAGAMADFAPIDGQGTWTINRSQTKIGTASKNKRGYATSAYGNMEVTIDLDINPTLPDAGYTALEAACLGVPKVTCMIELRKGGLTATAADAIFGSEVYASFPSTTGPLDDKISTKAQFAIADAPYKDQLA